MPGDSLAGQQRWETAISGEHAGETDSLTQGAAPAYTLVIERPAHPQLPLRSGGERISDSTSWIVGALLILFVIVAVRFSKNSRYLSAMLKDSYDIRERGNIFDDTVKETSFIWGLNALWCVCIGILLYHLLMITPEVALHFAGRIREWGIDPGILTLPSDHGEGAGMGVCIVIAAVFQLLMTLAYTIFGNIFSDSAHTRMWVKGFLSTTGLSTLILFPFALLTICYPGSETGTLICALFGFILAKIIFIWKGLRIFFTQSGSWVLFLYYLCSLEIVPLIIAYSIAGLICIVPG